MTYTVDKTGWPDGPWMSEPDCSFWVDEATALPCVILRTPRIGHLCGYVGVPPRHPHYMKDYDDAGARISVHGGLTFAGQTLIVIDPAQEEFKDYYWFGFDCGHAWDVSPGLIYRLGASIGHDVYKDLNFVRTETANLAQQLFFSQPALELLARAADDELRQPAE